jgi:hypothetical protein
MNTLAEKLKSDRLEFKMKNALGGYVDKENRASYNNRSRNGFLSQRSYGGGSSK